MNTVQKKYTIGVIVARFQVASLHEGHKELIDTVLTNHPKVMIFLGLSQVKGSINDPLDYQPRKQMILETFPLTQQCKSATIIKLRSLLLLDLLM